MPLEDEPTSVRSDPTDLSLGLLVAGLADRADEVILVLVTDSLLMYGLAALALVPIRRAVPAAATTGGRETSRG